ncbi:MAG: Gfo/Idh/MocA family oxidoreductase, partial [Chloroflexota bacterium]|nr:Gfo/Idh/MocA family oxidoreductase [Chloroflexota bacterium]
WDVGVYPLTLATAFFAPARRVIAYGKTLYPHRVTMEGVPFTIEAPDWTTAAIELEDGTVVRLTANFYVGRPTRQTGMEFHGDKGSLHISSWQEFNASVQFGEFGSQFSDVPYVRPPYKGIEWGRAVWDLADALRNDRPHRATGEQAVHIVEILEAISRSMQEGRPVEIHSSFTPPKPMEWAQ